MQRVMILGQPGSGKSTLARQLGARTGLPVVHIDHIHWMPGWVERPLAEKTRLCAEVHARPQWIFEGGHSETWPERLARADRVIWLDLPLGLRLWRVLKRTLKGYGRTRPDLPENCPEQFSLDFYRFIWRTRHSTRVDIQRLLDSAPAEKDVHVFTSAKELRLWLDSLPLQESDSGTAPC